MIIVRQIEGAVNTATRRSAIDELTSDLFGCPVVRDQNGAPSLENKLSPISISHTDRYIILAIQDKNVGVDAELINRNIKHLAPRFATENEIKICRRALPENPELLVWCTKEAVYKILHRTGVDFLRNMTITQATKQGRLWAVADEKIVELEFEIRDKLLIVCTI